MISEKSRLFLAFCNFPSRVLIFHGLALILSPSSGFNASYNLFFQIMSRNEWGLLCMVFGGIGFIGIYLEFYWLYRLALILSVFVFTAHSAIFLFSNAPTGFTTYGNIALNCLLISAGAPVYGFLAVKRNHSTPILKDHAEPPNRDSH